MKPLEGLRIIAVEQYGAGPWGSVHLADLGAEVIKVEDPTVGGDVSRYIPPYQEGEDSLFFETFNRNKLSVGLDITTEAGQQVFHDLVKVSDVVYSNLRGDVPAKLGLRYDDLKAYNAAIVCCSLSAFGMDSERSKEPGYDYILQGLAGWMSLTGEPDGPPTKSGLSLVDFAGGFVGAIAILSGVLAARRDGVGMDCDVCLYDTALSLLTYPATWHLNAGFEPVRTRHSAHPSLIPFQNFETADGWIVVGCAKEKFWTRLTEVLERPDLAEDPRFADFGARAANKDVLLPILEEAFRQRPAEHWLERLRTAGVPSGPINTVAEALADPYLKDRGLLLETEHERFGNVRQVGSPVRVGTAPSSHRRAPQRNEHADYVLSDLLEYGPEEIDELAHAGAFGGDGEQRSEAAQ